MIVTEDVFPLLDKLSKRQKLRAMQFLMSELILAETVMESPVSPEQIGWPPNYFEETFGALRDDPLERPKQGTFEVREIFA